MSKNGSRRDAEGAEEVGRSIIAIESPNGDPVHGWLCFSLPVALCVSGPLREVFTAWIQLSRDLACDRPTSPKAHLDIAPRGTGWRRPRRRSKIIPTAMRTSPPRILSKGGSVRMRPISEVSHLPPANLPRRRALSELAPLLRVRPD
jgi:hypothetical protein